MFDKKESTKVKGIAILLLLFHHLFSNADQVANSGMQFIIFSKETIRVLAVSARICVWIFAFISAYGLSYQYLNRKDESTTQFILRRWFSLMKGYWIVYIAVFAVSLFFARSPFEVYEGSILKCFLDFMGWADFFGTPMLSSVWWYMCFAQILLLLIPLANKISGGVYSVLMLFLVLQYLPEGIVSPYGGKYSYYFLVILLAVQCVKYQWFDKVLKKNSSSLKHVLGGIIAFCGLAVILIAKYKLSDTAQWQFGSLLSSISALLVCYLISKYCRNKYIEQLLSFLGKHSANIFMLHTFLYTYIPKCVYWSENAFISYCSLLILSILVSMILETIKKILHYNEGIKKLESLITAKVKCM